MRRAEERSLKLQPTQISTNGRNKFVLDNVENV